MRKHIREIMRREAERNHYKPSKAVNNLWSKLQDKRYGRNKHLAFQARGTRPKHKWPMAYERTFG